MSRRFELSDFDDSLDWPELILLLLVVAIALFAAVLTDQISSGAASIAATLLLVVITGFYAATTFATLRETRRAREQEMQPIFSFRPQEFRSTVVNLGNGPARHLELTLRLLPAGESYQIKRHSLAADARVAVRKEPFSSIADREYLGLQLQGADIDWDEYEDDETFWEEFDDYPYETLTMKGSCEDVWGNEWEIDESYNVRDLTREYVDSTDAAADPELSLEMISRELGEIRTVIEGLDGEA